jgi:hypothetical protein
MHDSRGTKHRIARVLATAAMGASLAGLGAPLLPVAAASTYDYHQGIDKCGDVSHTIVADLWNGSPPFNWGFTSGQRSPVLSRARPRRPSSHMFEASALGSSQSGMTCRRLLTAAPMRSNT